MFSHAQVCKKQTWKAACSITIHVTQWSTCYSKCFNAQVMHFSLKVTVSQFLCIFCSLPSPPRFYNLQCYNALSHLSNIFCHEHMAMNGCPHRRGIVWHVGKESELGITGGKGNSLQCMSHSNTLKLKQLFTRKSYANYYHFHHYFYYKQWLLL